MVESFPVEKDCRECGKTFDVMADGAEEVFKNADDGHDPYPVGYKCPECAS